MDNNRRDSSRPPAFATERGPTGPYADRIKRAVIEFSVPGQGQSPARLENDAIPKALVGAGLAKSRAATAYEAYQRANVTLKEYGGELKVVQQQGGQISVEATVKVPTTDRVWNPTISEMASQCPGLRVSLNKIPRGGTELILRSATTKSGEPIVERVSTNDCAYVFVLTPAGADVQNLAQTANDIHILFDSQTLRRTRFNYENAQSQAPFCSDGAIKT